MQEEYAGNGSHPIDLSQDTQIPQKKRKKIDFDFVF
jgi:hypothetical protein